MLRSLADSQRHVVSRVQRTPRVAGTHITVFVEGLGENVKNPSSLGSAMATEQTILVGKKPTTNYVIATVMAFNAGVKKVVLKARGAAISKAVSTAVMVRDRFLPGKVQIKDVKLLSDKVQGQVGRERTVAAVEIVIEMA